MKNLIAVVLTLLILCFALKLWRADLRVPLHYNGDALLHAMFIKGVSTNGWYWQNPSLGAPDGLKMYDFPAVDNSAAVVFWFISLFTANAILILNIFYLLTFPLVAVSSLYVFRQFNLPYAPSLFSALLFTFLPYHFMRGESHLFLSAYYFVPLVVLVLLWLTREEPFRLRGFKFVLSIVICVAVGSSGIYYPFFSCFLLLVAGAAGSLNQGRLRPLGVAALLVLITFAVLAINLSPSLVYIYRQGDAGITHRYLDGPEIYGLKIVQLLLPVSGHRIEFLNRLKRTYNEGTDVTESDAAALGFVGSVGFLVLIGQLLYRRRLVENGRLVNDLSILNIFAVLLGTVGGVGSLFAVFVSAGIRSYNRVSVFIAFFSLFAIAIGLDQIYRRYVKTSRARAVFHVLLGCVLLAGVYDQTTRAFVPEYASIKTEFLSDREFMKDVEASVPSGAMIFQLPYIPFPEHPRVNRMVDYDHLRGYLHSQNLHWSYGAMKNRDTDLWQQRVGALPVEELARVLSFSGFSGIYLDRNGYEDNGAARETELANVLQVKPLASRNGRLLFFNLGDYTSRLRKQYSEGEWQAKRELSLHPVRLEWRGGFSGFETAPGRTWRWCSNEGELVIDNRSPRGRQLRLEMWFATGHEQLDDLILSGLISEQLKINASPRFYSRTIVAPPGKSTIVFRSTAPRVEAPLDPRVLVFRIENFKLTEME